MLKSLCLGLAALLGAALQANGVFMLVAPDNWYFAVPGVTTTGPFNPHFVRDIGLIFLLIGGAFLVGASLCGADLRGAYLRLANFDGADLSDANLSGTVGLTQAQLARAHCNSTTKLPNGLIGRQHAKE